MKRFLDCNQDSLPSWLLWIRALLCDLLTTGAQHFCSKCSKVKNEVSITTIEEYVCILYLRYLCHIERKNRKVKNGTLRN